MISDAVILFSREASTVLLIKISRVDFVWRGAAFAKAESINRTRHKTFHTEFSDRNNAFDSLPPRTDRDQMRLSNTHFAANTKADPKRAHGATEKIPNTFSDIHFHRKPPKVNVIGIMVIVCNIKTCLKPITAVVCEAFRRRRRTHYQGIWRQGILRLMCAGHKRFNYFIISRTQI